MPTTIQASVLPYGVPSSARANRPVGMDVDGQPLAGVEQLDEQRGIGAALGGMVGAEEASRVGGDRVAQQLAAGQAAQAELVLAEHRRRGADPVLGHALARRLGASQRRDGRPAAIEARYAVRRQHDRPHAGTSTTRELLHPGRVHRPGLRRLDARRCGREAEGDRAVDRLAALERDAQAADERVARANRVLHLHARRRVPARLAALDDTAAPAAPGGDDRRARAACDEPLRRRGRSLPDLDRITRLDRLVGATQQQPLRLAEVGVATSGRASSAAASDSPFASTRAIARRSRASAMSRA